MGQVATLVEVHTHNGVAGLEHCKVYGSVCLCTRMRLYVCVLCAEQLACSPARDLLYNVYALAAAVVALSGITLCVFIGEMTAHSRHNGRCYDVFAGNQFKIAALSFKLVVHCVSDGGVILLKVFQCRDVC